MSKGVKSARGELVNFDLLQIKQQIASAPKPVDVKAREDFIDQRFKRRLKKMQRTVSEAAADLNIEPNTQEEVDEELIEDPSADPTEEAL